MNARPVLIVTTAGVADWAAESEHRTAWLAHSLRLASSPKTKETQVV